MSRPEPTTRTEAARDAQEYWRQVRAKYPDEPGPRQSQQEYVEHVLSRPGMWRDIARLLPPLEDADVAAPERGREGE